MLGIPCMSDIIWYVSICACLTLLNMTEFLLIGPFLLLNVF